MTTTSDQSIEAATGRVRAAVAHTSPADVQAILGTARQALGALSRTDAITRRTWIDAAATLLLERSDELVAIAAAETGLGLPRLQGELVKACANSRFYADVAVNGSYLAASSDSLGTGGTLVRWNRPIGTVAVFGASNFPFGFGVFGHDVASALAVGCPVIVKAHPAHPQLSTLIAAIVTEALDAAGAPRGTFSLVVGFDAGLALVDSDVVRAVAFTGSQQGGMALVQRAAPRGIPVFAEMGTVNPVVVTPSATARRDEIVREFVDSFTLGAGQFCTKPGLIFVPAGQGFASAITDEVAGRAGAVPLTAGIAERFAAGVAELTAASGLPQPQRPTQTDPARASFITPADHESGAADTSRLMAPHSIVVALDSLREGSRLLEECFGPVALIAEYDSLDEALATVVRLQPSLTGSLITGGITDPDVDTVIDVLLDRSGRVTVDSWPTGVATAWSQQHGGPWPATSRPDASSVGAAALNRFVRPVSLSYAQGGAAPRALQAAAVISPLPPVR